MTNQNLPEDLISVIGTDKIEFSVFAKRERPIGTLGSLLISLGVLWTLAMLFPINITFVPILKGEVVHFHLNGVARSASLENFKPIMVPALALLGSLLLGLGFILIGLYPVLQKGGYFVGTPKSLIHYKNGIISSYSWESFSDNIGVKLAKGDILLQLRTGEINTSKNSFSPTLIYISGITDTLNIVRACDKLIKENAVQ